MKTNNVKSNYHQVEDSHTNDPVEYEISVSAPDTLVQNIWPSPPEEPSLTDFDLQIIDILNELREHQLAASRDKYAAADIQLYPSELFMSDAHGKSINIFNAVKYLSRYLSEGFEKSNNRQDVIKAVHYLLFELARTK